MILMQNRTVFFRHIIRNQILKCIEIGNRIHGNLTKFMAICHQVPGPCHRRQIAINMRRNNRMYCKPRL